MVYLDQLGKDIECVLTTNYETYVKARKVSNVQNPKKITPDEWDAIHAILTLDICYYMLRRTPHVCGAHTDSVLQTRRQLINEYELIYGSYYDPNKNVNY